MNQAEMPADEKQNLAPAVPGQGSFKKALLVVALVVVGVGVFFVRARSEADLRRRGLADPEAKKHLVTDAMTEKAKQQELKPAPEFDLIDPVSGKSIRLKELAASKPVVVYFIKDGCPCSQTYEPFIQEFASNYADVAHVVGIIDGDADTARRWSSRYVNRYPIANDPANLTMIRWGATNSAFTALVDKQGKLVAYWPGYSRWMLEELSQKLAELAGVPRRRLAVLDAPSQLYTGCSFGEEDPSEIVRK
ncbi:MAG: TlpA family protein disulfide reductase [bacterium]